MQTFIIIIHLIIVSAMIGVVLLQRSEGGGLGIGSTGGFLTSRGTANVLTRTTALLAVIQLRRLFFWTACVVAGFGERPREGRRIIDRKFVTAASSHRGA